MMIPTTCAKCGRSWSMSSREAHCTGCCRHFGGDYGFVLHIAGPPDKPAQHLDPATLVGRKTGERLLHQDERGVWRRPTSRALGKLAPRTIRLTTSTPERKTAA